MKQKGRITFLKRVVSQNSDEIKLAEETITHLVEVVELAKVELAELTDQKDEVSE